MPLINPKSIIIDITDSLKGKITAFLVGGGGFNPRVLLYFASIASNHKYLNIIENCDGNENKIICGNLNN